MTIKTLRLVVSLLLLLATEAFQSPADVKRALPAYTITDLGTLGGTEGKATSINGEGDVVGMADDADGREHPFLYRAGKMKDLYDDTNGFYRAYAINDEGLILGSRQNKNHKTHLCLWQEGQISVVDVPDGHSYGLNNQGQVVGHLGIDTQWSQGFLYQNGTMTILGKLDGGYCLRANAINNNDQIVGDGDAKSFKRHALLYDHQQGIVTDLGTLKGDKASHSKALAINDRGQAVGSSSAIGGLDHAFLYSEGKMIDLGTLNRTANYFIACFYVSDFSEALGINTQGQIVGCVNGGDMPHAFLYEKKVMRDLNDLLPRNSGWILTSATAINEKGQIVGNGRHNGFKHAFLLAPRGVD